MEEMPCNSPLHCDDLAQGTIVEALEKASIKNPSRGDSCEPDSLEYRTFCPKIRKKGVKFIK